ncbi:MAG: orotate phosphoribosyltransferase [Polyangiales bacterium]
MDKAELAKRIVEVALLRGAFTLRSGKTSDFYLDKYQFEADPTLLRELAKALSQLIPQDTEVLAGLELGGVPLATALALETGLPAAFVRKERKQYGTCQIAEGTRLKGKRVTIIEDVVTTGGAVLDSARALRDEGAQLLGVLSVISRADNLDARFTTENLKLTALFAMSDLEPYMR